MSSIVGGAGIGGRGLQVDGKDAAQNPRLLQKGMVPGQYVSPCVRSKIHNSFNNAQRNAKPGQQLHKNMLHLQNCTSTSLRFCKY